MSRLEIVLLCTRDRGDNEITSVLERAISSVRIYRSAESKQSTWWNVTWNNVLRMTVLPLCIQNYIFIIYKTMMKTSNGKKLPSYTYVSSLHSVLDTCVHSVLKNKCLLNYLNFDDTCTWRIHVYLINSLDVYCISAYCITPFFKYIKWS